MPKKEWTEEERKAFGEKMKKSRQKRLAKEVDEKEVEIPQFEETPKEQPTASSPSGQNVALSQEQFQQLLNMLGGNTKPTSDDASVVERFPLQASFYPNPVKDLLGLAELKRYAMEDNFILEYKVNKVKYQTQQGTWYVEPRFDLVLKKRQFNEDGKEVTKVDAKGDTVFPRIVISRAMFFEDPPANIEEAELAGITLEEAEEMDAKEFANRLRFWRYKMWLTEKISPVRREFTTNQVNEEVIGGKSYRIENSSKPI